MYAITADQAIADAPIVKIKERVRQTYGISDLCVLLEVSNTTLHRLRKRGLIPSPLDRPGYPAWSCSTIHNWYEHVWSKKEDPFRS